MSLQSVYGKRVVKLQQQVPGLGNLSLAAYCVSRSDGLEKPGNGNCIVVLLSPKLAIGRRLSVYDLLTTLAAVYALRRRGLGIARKPYIDVLILALRNRNIAEILEANRIDREERLILLAACPSTSDLEALEESIASSILDIDDCGLPTLLEPISTDDIAVFALDSKAYGSPTRWAKLKA